MFKNTRGTSEIYSLILIINNQGHNREKIPNVIEKMQCNTDLLILNLTKHIYRCLKTM